MARQGKVVKVAGGRVIQKYKWLRRYLVRSIQVDLDGLAGVEIFSDDAFSDALGPDVLDDLG
jgi:hypothetical protein